MTRRLAPCRAAALAALLASVAAARPARAEPAPCDDGSAAARYDAITTLLASERASGLRWTHRWTLVFTAGAALQGAGAALIDHQPERAELAVGAIQSGLAAFGTFVLNGQRYEVPGAVAAATCADVTRAEALLEAADERQTVHWYHHAQVVAVNAAGYLYLGLEHDDWARAAAGALIGAAIGEYQLYTLPDGASRALAARDDLAWTVVPMITPTAATLSLAARF